MGENKRRRGHPHFLHLVKVAITNLRLAHGCKLKQICEKVHYRYGDSLPSNYKRRISCALKKLERGGYVQKFGARYKLASHHSRRHHSRHRHLHLGRHHRRRHHSRRKHHRKRHHRKHHGRKHHRRRHHRRRLAGKRRHHPGKHHLRRRRHHKKKPLRRRLKHHRRRYKGPRIHRRRVHHRRKYRHRKRAIRGLDPSAAAGKGISPIVSAPSSPNPSTTPAPST